MKAEILKAFEDLGVPEKKFWRKSHKYLNISEVVSFVGGYNFWKATTRKKVSQTMKLDRFA